MRKKDNDGLMQDLNIQEVEDINGGIGIWMYIDPLVCVVTLKVFDNIKNVQ